QDSVCERRIGAGDCRLESVRAEWGRRCPRAGRGRTRTVAHMAVNRIRLLAAMAFPAALLPTVSGAQTTSSSDLSDRFFDDAVLHDLSISIGTAEWAALKEHYLEFTYYPCDLKWNDLTVRNIGIRSYGTGSRRS